MPYLPELNDTYVSPVTGELWYVKEILTTDPYTGKPKKGYWFADPYQYNADRYLTEEGLQDFIKHKLLKLAWTAAQVKKERWKK